MERSYQLNPDFPPSLVLRAALLQHAGRTAEAADAIRRLRALEPDTAAAIHIGRWFGLTHRETSAPLIAAFDAAWAETPA
jgi:hypothetical protein